MRDACRTIGLKPAPASLTGWVARSDQTLEAATFAEFAVEVLAGLPPDERSQALSMLAAASASLRAPAHGG